MTPILLCLGVALGICIVDPPSPPPDRRVTVACAWPAELARHLAVRVCEPEERT